MVFPPIWGKTNGGVLSMRMQVILDSSFARPGSVPIWGGKKGEFRDWTNEEFDMREDKESINTAIDLEDKYANIESDSEKEQDSDSESHGNDPCDDLLIKVKSSLPQRYGILINKG